MPLTTPLVLADRALTPAPRLGRASDLPAGRREVGLTTRLAPPTTPTEPAAAGDEVPDRTDLGESLDEVTAQLELVANQRQLSGVERAERAELVALTPPRASS